MPRVAKVRKDEDGDIMKIMLTNGRILTEHQAVREAKQGLIDNVHAVKPKFRKPYIRTNPNSSEKDNLNAKPTF